MNIDDHVESCLGFFKDEVGILDEVLFIGAWARYFYRSLFKGNADYQARLATKDLDVLLDRKKARHKKIVDVHQKLIEVGYQPTYYQSKLIKYHQDDLELEFLVPAVGSSRHQAVKVQAYNLIAQELPYLQMLWDHPAAVKYGRYEVNVPEPVTFALHKLIISVRRQKPASAEQDKRDAEEVLYALRNDSSFEERVQTAVARLKRKALQGVRDGIETFVLPEFRDEMKRIIYS